LIQVFQMASFHKESILTVRSFELAHHERRIAFFHGPILQLQQNAEHSVETDDVFGVDARRLFARLISSKITGAS